MRIIVFFILLLIPGLTSAQSFGTLGTRAEGMGGAFVAVADDASAVFWNPAGMALGATFDFQVSHADAAPGTSWFVGATMPVLGFSHYRTHTVQGFPDRENGGSGRVPVRTLVSATTGVTLAQSIVPSLVVGTTLKIVRAGFEDLERRTTTDLDAGVMWVTARNLRQPEFDSDFGPVKVKRIVRGGVAFAPRSVVSGIHGPLTVAFDADLTDNGIDGDSRTAAFGAEYWLIHGIVGVRSGVKWAAKGDAQQAVSGGLTVRLPKSVFVEGQLTEPDEDAEREWTVGLRVTF
jgi:hypothetical protein